MNSLTFPKVKQPFSERGRIFAQLYEDTLLIADELAPLIAPEIDDPVIAKLRGNKPLGEPVREIVGLDMNAA